MANTDEKHLALIERLPMEAWDDRDEDLGTVSEVREKLAEWVWSWRNAGSWENQAEAEKDSWRDTADDFLRDLGVR